MNKLIINCIVVFAVLPVFSQTPPYSGTIFIESEIITSKDLSALQSTTYTGQGMVTMYDRRTSSWVNVNAFLFEIKWDDGMTSRAQINAEFGNVENATKEAEKYGFLVGQLPACLRKDVNQIWVHKGVEPFGGGNNSILIHTGQTSLYEKDGILEETLVHEASHTSLDATHANAAGWLNAQKLDGNFISTYARDNPTREDIAESFLTWMAVRHRKDKISDGNLKSILQTIPNRLNYFDSFNFDLYPFVNIKVSAATYESKKIKIYPNPATDIIYLSTEEADKNDIRIYNLFGQDFTNQITFNNQKINVSRLIKGQYILKVNSVTQIIYIE